MIGRFNVTLREMSSPGAVYKFINPEKKGKMLYKHSGQFYVDSCVPTTITTSQYKGYQFTFSADNIEKKDNLGFGKSDPYLVFKVKRFPAKNAILRKHRFKQLKSISLLKKEKRLHKL